MTVNVYSYFYPRSALLPQTPEHVASYKATIEQSVASLDKVWESPWCLCECSVGMKYEILPIVRVDVV